MKKKKFKRSRAVKQVLVKKKPTAKEIEIAQEKIDAEDAKVLQDGHSSEIREKLFINEYLKDFNATRAAIDAGYSKDSAATLAGRLLRKVEIKEAIRSRLANRIAVLGLDQDFVIRNLLALYDRCMQVEPVLNSQGEETGVYKFDSKGASRALELIGKHMNMFPTTLRGDPNSPLESAPKVIVYLPTNER